MKKSTQSPQEQKNLLDLVNLFFHKDWIICNPKKGTGKRNHEFCDKLIIFENDIFVIQEKSIQPGKEYNKIIQTYFSQIKEGLVQIVKSKRHLEDGGKIYRQGNNKEVNVDCNKRIHYLILGEGIEPIKNLSDDDFDKFIDEKWKLEQNLIPSLYNPRSNDFFNVKEEFKDDFYVHIMDSEQFKFHIKYLDTPVDFANFLYIYKEFYSNKNISVIIEGETSILAWYLNKGNLDFNDHNFIHFTEIPLPNYRNNSLRFDELIKSLVSHPEFASEDAKIVLSKLHSLQRYERDYICEKISFTKDASYHIINNGINSLAFVHIWIPLDICQNQQREKCLDALKNLVMDKIKMGKFSHIKELIILNPSPEQKIISFGHKLGYIKL